MSKRVANKDARSRVQKREEFEGSNTFGVWKYTPDDAERYVVYSYGLHWPLFIYEAGKWYENDDRYSRTTTQHRSQLHPLCQTEKHPVEDMKDIALLGVANWMARKLQAA